MDDASSVSSGGPTAAGGGAGDTEEEQELPSFVDPSLEDTRSDRRARSSLCLYVSRAIIANQEDASVREVSEMLTKKVGFRFPMGREAVLEDVGPALSAIL